MMRSLLIFLLIGFAAFACNKKEEQKSSHINYEMKTFRLESKGGCQSDTSGCAIYELVYPEFSGLSDVADDTLNRRIIKSVSTGNPEIQANSFNEIGKVFVNDFDKVRKEFPDAIGWYYKASVAVNLLTDTLVSLESKSEFFTGGAHGGYGTYYINIRPSTGARIKLKDILNPAIKSPYEKLLRLNFVNHLNLQIPLPWLKKDSNFQMIDSH